MCKEPEESIYELLLIMLTVPDGSSDYWAILSESAKMVKVRKQILLPHIRNSITIQQDNRRP
jgi:hypothetical protein